MAGERRTRGLRTGIYLGASGKLAKQLKWANDQRARFVLIYGADERSAGEITTRDSLSRAYGSPRRSAKAPASRDISSSHTPAAG